MPNCTRTVWCNKKPTPRFAHPSQGGDQNSGVCPGSPPPEGWPQAGVGWSPRHATIWSTSVFRRLGKNTAQTIQCLEKGGAGCSNSWILRQEWGVSLREGACYVRDDYLAECWSSGVMEHCFAAWPRKVATGCKSVTQVRLFCGRELQLPRASACGWGWRGSWSSRPQGRWTLMRGSGRSNTPILPVALAHVGLCAASSFTPHSWYVYNPWKTRRV